MKLTIASTSLAASLSAPSISSFGVAASILEHENNQGIIGTSATENKECTFANEVNIRKKSSDVGILSCDMGDLCVEDFTSSLGGRCVSVSSVPVALGAQPERQLCDKCVGDEYQACFGVDQSNIACGSCMGNHACNGLPDSVTVGVNSCIGYKACHYAAYNIGENSCVGYSACHYAEGELILVCLLTTKSVNETISFSCLSLFSQSVSVTTVGESCHVSNAITKCLC